MESKGRRVVGAAAPPPKQIPAAPAEPRAAVPRSKPAKPVAAQPSARPSEPPLPSASDRPAVSNAGQISAGQISAGQISPRPPEPIAPIPVEAPAKAVASPSLVRATEASLSVAGETLPEAPAAVPDVVVQRLAPAPSTVAPAPSAVVPPTLAAPAKIADTSGDSCGILSKSQAAVSRGLQALGDELACYARRSMETLACTAIDTLSVKTWSDAVAVNSRLARTSFDQWVDSAAKVSELGIKLANDAAKPLLAKMGVAWRPVPPG